MSTAAFGLGFAEALIILLMGGGLGLPVGIPPADEDPRMAQIAPEKCLYYATWAAMARPDPASENHTERLVAEPEIQQAMLQRVEDLGTSRAEMEF